MPDRYTTLPTYDGAVEQPEVAKPEVTSVKINKPTETVATSGAVKPLNLKYPLENQDYYKAGIRFSLYEINPYTIDKEAASQIADMPFLFKSKNVEKKGQDSKSQDAKKSGSDAPNIGALGPPGTSSGDRTASARAGNPFERQAQEVAAQRAKAEQDATGTNRDLSLNPTDLNQHVTLYFPPNVANVDAVTYSNANLGPGGATALAASRNQGSLIGSVAKGVTEGAADLFNLLKGDLASAEAAQIAATRAFNKLPSGGIQNFTRVALQKIINPNTRSMFEGPTIRKFTFVFKLIATSSKEATEIQDIIRKFRSEMYPEAIEIGGLPIGFNFPKMFKIQYLYNGVRNTKLPQPLMCYLENATTTYNSSNMVFHADGQPTEVDLSLTFTEFRALTKKDILEGSVATNVGPH